jgi:hypothetical protein
MNKRLILGVAAVGLALLASRGSVKAVLLPNGDFETPSQGSSYSGSQFLPVGTQIPGWTVVGTGGVNVDQTFSPTPYWPGNITQFMDLTGNTGGGGVLSAPFITTVGQTYAISFNSYNGSLVYPGVQYLGSAFSVQATSGLLVTYTGAQNLLPNTVLTYVFTANNASSTVTFMDTSGFDSNAGWIDNVSLTAVPETTTMIAGALLLLPFGASTLRVLRRRTA